MAADQHAAIALPETLNIRATSGSWSRSETPRRGILPEVRPGNPHSDVDVAQRPGSASRIAV
eukprot:870600-Prorocentrum_lima.AAC.1